MKKVVIKGTYNLQQGKTIIVTADEIICIGDEVYGDDGIVYKVKSIIMPNRPVDDDRFAIVVEDYHK